jgi:hypothetical protein
VPIYGGNAEIDLLSLVVGHLVNEFNGVHVLAAPWRPEVGTNARAYLPAALRTPTASLDTDLLGTVLPIQKKN